MVHKSRPSTKNITPASRGSRSTNQAEIGCNTKQIRLKPYPVVGLDTAIFIYHFEENLDYLPLTRELLSSIETGERKGITSAITLMEIIAKPLDLGQIDVARKYEALLANFPNLEMIDLDRDVI